MPKRALMVAGPDGMAPALQMQIELWGDAVDWTVATSANEALWEVRGSPYVLVVAPYQLPDMGGMDFAEVVLKLSPTTRVVLVGVPMTPAIQNRAQALGVFGLLSDAEPQQVAALISRALEVPIPVPGPGFKPPGKTPVSSEVVPPEPLSSRPPVSPRAQQALHVTPAKPVGPTEAGTAAVPVQERRAVTWTPEQQARVGRALQELVASIGPLLALLVDVQGQVLLREGGVRVPEAEDLAAQVVRVLMVREEMARLLADDRLTGFLFFTGARYDLYAFPVTEASLLLLVFDRTLAEGKLGPAWLYARKSVEELRSALSP